jgi:hypothetical protein
MIMKKMMSKNTTSIIGVMFISMSVRGLCLFSFMGSSLGPGLDSGSLGGRLGALPDRPGE